MLVPNLPKLNRHRNKSGLQYSGVHAKTAQSRSSRFVGQEHFFSFRFPVSFHLRGFVVLASFVVVVKSSRRRSSGPGAERPARSESTSSSALARRPGSPLAACSSSSQPQDDPPPAWAQQLMAQVAELKSASGDLRREREVGEVSDTDTEFARPRSPRSVCGEQARTVGVSSHQSQPVKGHRAG